MKSKKPTTMTLLAAGAFVLGTALVGCGSKQSTGTVPPPATEASLPPVPANVPADQQEQVKQQMMQSMQAGRQAAMRINGQKQ